MQGHSSHKNRLEIYMAMKHGNRRGMSLQPEILHRPGCWQHCRRSQSLNIHPRVFHPLWLHRSCQDSEGQQPPASSPLGISQHMVNTSPEMIQTGFSRNVFSLCNAANTGKQPINKAANTSTQNTYNFFSQWQCQNYYFDFMLHLYVHSRGGIKIQ